MSSLSSDRQVCIRGSKQLRYLVFDVVCCALLCSPVLSCALLCCAALSPDGIWSGTHRTVSLPPGVRLAPHASASTRDSLQVYRRHTVSLLSVDRDGGVLLRQHGDEPPLFSLRLQPGGDAWLVCSGVSAT
jgi:hypothetical protein